MASAEKGLLMHETTGCHLVGWLYSQIVKPATSSRGPELLPFQIGHCCASQMPRACCADPIG